MLKNQDGTKRCSTCKETKSLEDFCRLKSSKDGRHNQCKPCARETQNRTRKAYQKDKAVYRKLSLEEEKAILTRIKKGDGEAYFEVKELMKGFKRFHALKHRAYLDDSEYEELLWVLDDKLFDRLKRLSKKPERRGVGWRSGKPALLSQLSVYMKYDALKFLIKTIENRWYKNRNHIKFDRRSKKLTPAERKEILDRLGKGESPYKLALHFSMSSGNIFRIRREVEDPGYTKRKWDARRHIYNKNRNERRKKLKEAGLPYS